MTVESFLNRLERVKPTGRNRWLARCPAHADRGPSLSVRELDDGRILLHDFGGCSTAEVLGALGLGFDALYPERPLGDRLPRERKPYSVRDLVAALRHELTGAWVILAAVHAGRPISNDYRARAGVAVDRILRFIGELDHAA